MPEQPPELVTVVIPAYNAAGTIDETLRSVRAQTHRALEILVVDDGSSDATAAIAQRHAAIDERITVLRTPNGGVAAARNHGWRHGRADLFAFVDADDLWAPDKTERQLAALHAMPEAQLVYSGYVIIDEASRITLEWEGVRWQGDVLDRLLVENFVGNGSAVIVTRRALEDAGGFEPALRAANAGGCEDILFYSRVAERHPFALAPGKLIGYRYIDNNMSSDLARMLRSWRLVQAEMASRHPDRQAFMDQGFERFARWLVRRAVLIGQPRHLPRLYAEIARTSHVQAVRIFAGEVPRAMRDRPRLSKDPGPRFSIGTPETLPATA